MSAADDLHAGLSEYVFRGHMPKWKADMLAGRVVEFLLANPRQLGQVCNEERAQ